MAKGKLVDILEGKDFWGSESGKHYCLFSGTSAELSAILGQLDVEIEDAERCPECGHILRDEDCIFEERVAGEYCGQTAFEDVMVGIECSYCGHSEYWG